MEVLEKVCRELQQYARYKDDRRYLRMWVLYVRPLRYPCSVSSTRLSAPDRVSVHTGTSLMCQAHQDCPHDCLNVWARLWPDRVYSMSSRNVVHITCIHLPSS